MKECICRWIFLFFHDSKREKNPQFFLFTFLLFSFLCFLGKMVKPSIKLNQQIFVAAYGNNSKKNSLLFIFMRKRNIGLVCKGCPVAFIERITKHIHMHQQQHYYFFAQFFKMLKESNGSHCSLLIYFHCCCLLY